MKKTVIYGIFGILIILLASCSKEEQVATVVETTEAEPIYAVTVTKAIQGELKDLLANAVDTEDYIYATLTDEKAQFDAMARLQEIYPNIMKLDYDNVSTRALQENDVEETEGKTFEELIVDFYQWMNGKEPSSEEWKILQEVAKEAGVIE